MGEKSKIMVIGGTGYLGKRLVKASIALGHPTVVVSRSQTAVSELSKSHTLIEFSKLGAQLHQCSLDAPDEMVTLLRQVDVVICAVSGISMRQQLKLVDAIKEAGNIKRFLPTEFGMDADRMKHAIRPADMVFECKREVRRAIEKASIPYTYIIANCFAGHFLAGLAQPGSPMPPKDHVHIYGDGDNKCIWVDEDDVAMYTLRTISDDRTLNRIVHIRPPANIVSQMEVVRMWEEMACRKLEKTFVSAEEFLRTLPSAEFHMQIHGSMIYHIFYCGDLLFELNEAADLDATVLYPDHKYVTAREYLMRLLPEE